MTRSYAIYDDSDVTHPIDVEISCLTGPNASVAAITYDDGNGKRLTVYGDSKRNKGEVKDADVGFDLAIGRAFISLGDELVSEALRRIG